jgi:hypothetical protein
MTGGLKWWSKRSDERLPHPIPPRGGDYSDVFLHPLRFALCASCPYLYSAVSASTAGFCRPSGGVYSARAESPADMISAQTMEPYGTKYSAAEL